MLHLVLPYTSSLAKATNLSYGVRALDATSMSLSARIIRAITDAVTIIAISRSVASLATEKGGTNATFYAVVLTLLAYTIPRMMMESTLIKLCKDCPANGLMSMAIVTLIIFFAIEQGIRATL